MIACPMVAEVHFVVVAASFLQGSAQLDVCAFPGDCLKHNSGRRTGKCICASAYRERWLKAATPEERAEVYRSEYIRVEDRILRDYEATKSQEQMIRRVLKNARAEHRATMGETFAEAAGVHRHMIDRLKQHIEYRQRLQSGEDVEPMPSIRDDPIYNDLRDSMGDIEKKFPFDWVAVADRIEKLLPAAQAVRGRNRLIEEVPHRFAPREWEVTATGARASGTSRTVVHPWKSYVRRFVSEHGLTSSQQGAATSVLKELMERAETARRSTFKRLAAGGSLPGEELQKQMENLETETDILFEELKMRLFALLTNAQRDAKPSPATAGKP